MSERIEVVIDVFGDTERALVLPNATVKTLMKEITEEFEGIEVDDLEQFVLTRKLSDSVLDPSQTLPQLNIRNGDELAFQYKKNKTLRQPLSGKSKAVLVDNVTGATFSLMWQPAVIGRREGMSLAELLAVDLTYDINARRISRMHTQITERNGIWFIERLSNTNPTYLNGRSLSEGKHELADGDEIQPGRKTVTLKFQIVR